MQFPSLLRSSLQRPWLPLLAMLAVTSTARAQWALETYDLKPGWNAIWLPLDVSHATNLATLAHADIEELWRWNASEPGHYADSPAGAPSQTELQWNVWRRTNAEATTLGQMTGNAAYLVKVSDSAAPFTWNVVGKPLVPAFEWSSSGVNFVGFPIENPPSSSLRSMDRFFRYNEVLKALPTTLYYNGGPLSDVAPKNPLVIGNMSSTAAVRGRAYWVRANSYTDYYGPLKVEVGTSNGMDFGTNKLSVSVRLKNVVDPVRNQTVTVTLSQAASEVPPSGQPANAGDVPLLVRGSLNLSTAQHNYDQFTAPITRTLPPGESTEIIFTVNRSALGNTAGSVFQSLLVVKDSLNQTRINLPVRAEVASRAGLWTGVAMISNVERVKMERTGDDSDKAPAEGTVSPEPNIDPATGRPIIVRTTTKTPEVAPAQFPLNLLIHSDAAGTVRLLQQAYIGEEQGNSSIASTQAAFTDVTKVFGRTSSSHFPLSTKETGTGVLGLSGELSFTVTLGESNETNPFLHAYHPDHDNLTPRFEPITSGAKEVPTVQRAIKLTFNNPTVFNPAWGASQLGGEYTETVTGLRAQPIVSKGTFLIQRVNSAPTFLNP